MLCEDKISLGQITQNCPLSSYRKQGPWMLNVIGYRKHLTHSKYSRDISSLLPFLKTCLKFLQTYNIFSHVFGKHTFCLMVSLSFYFLWNKTPLTKRSMLPRVVPVHLPVYLRCSSCPGWGFPSVFLCDGKARRRLHEHVSEMFDLCFREKTACYFFPKQPDLRRASKCHGWLCCASSISGNHIGKKKIFLLRNSHYPGTGPFIYCLPCHVSVSYLQAEFTKGNDGSK